MGAIVNVLSVLDTEVTAEPGGTDHVPSARRKFVVPPPEALKDGAAVELEKLPKTEKAGAFDSEKLRAGVVVLVATEVVNSGDRFPEVKLVTVPLPPPPPVAVNTPPEQVIVVPSHFATPKADEEARSDSVATVARLPALLLTLQRCAVLSAQSKSCPLDPPVQVPSVKMAVPPLLEPSFTAKGMVEVTKPGLVVSLRCPFPMVVETPVPLKMG